VEKGSVGDLGALEQRRRRESLKLEVWNDVMEEEYPRRNYL